MPVSDAPTEPQGYDPGLDLFLWPAEPRAGLPHTPNSQIPQRTDYCQVTREVLVLLGTERAEPVLFSVRFGAAQVWKVLIPV